MAGSRRGVRRGPYKGKAEYGATTASGRGAEWRRVRLQVLERDGRVCRYCGRAATTVDHVVPKIKGGSDDLGNLVAACVRCNTSKGDRPAPGRRRSPAAAPAPVRRAGWYTPAGFGPCSQQWCSDYVWEGGT